MELFVDTSALIALANREDQFHALAAKSLETLDPSTKFHTSNYIIDETITRIRITASHKCAVAFGKNIFLSHLYRIHYIDEELEKEAFSIFEKYADKKLSFTDCTTFALMRKLDMKKVFAFDDDFAKVGFEVLPLKPNT